MLLMISAGVEYTLVGIFLLAVCIACPDASSGEKCATFPKHVIPGSKLLWARHFFRFVSRVGTSLAKVFSLLVPFEKN